MGSISTVKKVCLITPSHISSNPRLVKEAIALANRNYKVHIVFAQYVSYLVEHDKQILSAHPQWTYECIEFTGNSMFYKTRRLFLLSVIKLINYTGLVFKYGSLVSNPNFKWQLKKAVASKADLYIAHNLGALSIAVKAAEKNNSKCGFDAEDFHRNEVTDDVLSTDVKLKTAIEDKYIPQLDHFTAASPLIAGMYKSLYKVDCTSILNTFPKITPYHANDHAVQPLRLFWFSQTIGPNRGIELIIKAINITDIKMQLHLLGNQVAGYKQALLALADPLFCNIVFHDSVAPDEIFDLAKTFDIGFAAEPSIPLNRNICLTNKLFTYIQCGLAVVASNTRAQTDFIATYPTAGKLYAYAHELSTLLAAYHNDRDALKKDKQACYDLGIQKLNWETESEKFIGIVKQTLT
jgi:glycosyltransferase involved in cell wall biosynthesis